MSNICIYIQEVWDLVRMAAWALPACISIYLYGYSATYYQDSRRVGWYIYIRGVICIYMYRTVWDMEEERPS